jgi:hypothetical protein
VLKNLESKALDSTWDNECKKETHSSLKDEASPVVWLIYLIPMKLVVFEL